MTNKIINTENLRFNYIGHHRSNKHWINRKSEKLDQKRDKETSNQDFRKLFWCRLLSNNCKFCQEKYRKTFSRTVAGNGFKN